MNKIKKFLAATALSLLLILPGCAKDNTVTQLSTIVLNAPALIASVEGAYTEIKAANDLKEFFNADEIAILTESMSVYNVAKTEYEALASLQTMPDAKEALELWRQIELAYNNAMVVVNAHKSEYAATTIVKINVMDAYAKKADTDVLALLTNPTTTGISEALKIIAGLITIGAKVAVLI